MAGIVGIKLLDEEDRVAVVYPDGMELVTSELGVNSSLLSVRPVEEPDPDPDPDPIPGEVVFSCDFTDQQFSEWVQIPATLPNSRGEQNPPFQRGNARSHGGDETGPEGQTTSLRMGMGECRLRTTPLEFCFPPGESAYIVRVLNLPAGDYDLDCYQVQHDLGKFVLRVEDAFDLLAEVVGAWADGPYKWDALPKPLAFSHAGGELRISVAYTAHETDKGGIKVTGLRVRRIS